MNTPQQPAERGPTGRRRLAAALRQARAEAGITQTAAAAAVDRRQPWIAKIESAALLPEPPDVDTLTRAYKLRAAERRALVDLAEHLHAERSNRVVLRRGIAGQHQRWFGELEAAATEIRSYQPCTVIGLLQTPGYIRAVMSQPDAGLTTEQIGEAIEARAGRQGLLTSGTGKKFSFILTEGALRWQAGSPDVMVEQLRHLAEVAVAQMPNVQLGIIPWTQPVQVFTNGGFHILDRDAVLVANELATLTPTGVNDVEAYLHRFATLERLASFNQDAASHFKRIGEEYAALRDTFQ